MEAELLFKIHGLSSPLLDALFRLSDLVGGTACSSALVIALALWHVTRRERHAAALWVAMGILIVAELEGLKSLVERPRPELWTRLIHTPGSSFPSGHALAAASLYPLLVWGTLRGRAGWVAGSLALLGVLFVGVGRLYLGVHWPTDVLAGWSLGALQSFVAIRQLRLEQGTPGASRD